MNPVLPNNKHNNIKAKHKKESFSFSLQLSLTKTTFLTIPFIQSTMKFNLPKRTLTRSSSEKTWKEYAAAEGVFGRALQEFVTSIVSGTTASSESTTPASSSLSEHKAMDKTDVEQSMEDGDGQNKADVVAMFRPLVAEYLPDDRLSLEIKGRDGTLYTSATITERSFIRDVTTECTEEELTLFDQDGNEVTDIDAASTTKTLGTDKKATTEFRLDDVKVHKSCHTTRLYGVEILVGGNLVGSIQVGSTTETLNNTPTTFHPNAKRAIFNVCERLIVEASAEVVPDYVWKKIKEKELVIDLFDLWRRFEEHLESKRWLPFDERRRRDEAEIDEGVSYFPSEWTVRFDKISISNEYFLHIINEFIERTHV